MRRIAAIPLVLGALTALLIYFACPPYNLGWLAWIALVPLCAGIAALGHGAQAGAVAAGALLGAALFHPVLFVPGGTLAERIGGWIALVFLVTLFFLLFGWAAARLRRTWPRAVPLLLPLVWIALEYGFRLVFWGFAPYLGVTQWQNRWMLGLAAYTGIHGVSAAVVAVNVAASELLAGLLGLGSETARLRVGGLHGVRRPPLQWFPIAFGLLTALAVIGQESLTLAAIRGAGSSPGAAGVQRVYLVQPGFTASEYDAAQSLADHEALFRRARALTASALQGGGADETATFPQPLVVWPETVLHYPAYENPALREQVRAAAREWGAWFLLGLPREDRSSRGGEILRNSAFLLSPAGADVGFYDKVHVIPIAEDQFTPGDQPRVFPAGGHVFGVGICSDAVVPAHARSAVLQGAQALYYLSSLGRIGDLAAVEVALVAFRAAENRVPALQAATTGHSVVFGPDGRLVAQLAEGEGVLAANVEVSGAPGSFYTRYGDLPVLLGGVIMFASGVIQSRRRVRVW